MSTPRILLGLCILFCHYTFAQINLNSGLIAHLPMNGNGTDISGNNNHAASSAFGVSPVRNYLNQIGLATLFDGANAQGMLTFGSPLLNNQTNFTMSYWFNLSQLSPTMSLVGQDNILETAFNTGPNQLIVYHPNGTVNLTSVSSANVWYHLLVTCSPTQMQVYLNGTLANTLSGNFSLGNNTTATRIGGNVMNQNNNTWLRGSVDEVRFYNRVLSAQEIALLANTSPLSVGITSLNSSIYCAGAALQVSFSATGNILAGNEYILEMSDASGSFTNAVPVARMSSTANTGTFNTTVPTGTPTGSGYRFRVNSTNLNSIGTSSSAVTINGVVGNIPSATAFRYIGNINGKDYYVSLNPQTLSNARTTCLSNGGVLAGVPDSSVNILFEANLTTTDAWIGYTDEVTEGIFRWMNGASVTYTNWNSGEPNNSGNEDYTSMLATTGRWNDQNGTQNNLFFMELAPAGITQTVCAGSVLNLSAVNITGATYSWSGPNGFSSGIRTPQINPATTQAQGIYTAVISSGGCSTSAQTNVFINASPLGIGQTSALPASLSSGLVLHYPMNGNSLDASGNGINGIINGGVTAAADRFGNPGQALQFNGSNGFIDVPDGVYFNGSDFTVNVWARASSFGNWARVFDFANGPNSNNIVLVITNGTSGRPAFVVYNGASVGTNFTAPNAVALNTWNMLTVTYTNGNSTLSINGVPVIMGATSSPVNILRTINYIGRSNFASDAYFNGSMDDFRLYNRVLTQSEISALLLLQTDAPAYQVSATPICSGNTGQVLLLNSQPGVSYQLLNQSTNALIGTAQNGNGDTLIFTAPALTASTPVYFNTTVTSSGCTGSTTPAATIPVTPPLTAPSVLNDSVCNEGILTVTASGVPNGGQYNWYTQASGGTPIAGNTGNSLTTPFIRETRNYWVSVSSAQGCESPRTQVSAVVLNPLNPPVDLNTGLIMLYRLNGNTADSSGNGLNATAFGTNSFVPDRNGNPNAALNVLNTGYLDAGNPAQIQQLTNQITISLWIRQTQSWFGDNTPLANRWNGNGIYMGLEGASANPFSNPVRWRIDNSGVLISNTNVPILQWHHIVCTYNGAQLRIYQNGVLTGTLNETGGIPNSGSLQFGRQMNGGGPITFRGDMDQIRVYNRALNANEALTLFNNESVAFSNSPLCDGQGNLSLSTFAFPGATYQWSGPNGFSSTQQNPPVINNAGLSASGTYTLQVSNYGCTSVPQTANVVINPLPSVSITVNDTVCGSGNADLIVGGAGSGATYAWFTQPSGGSAISGQTDSTYTTSGVSTTTTFYVSGSRNGCQGSRSPVTAVYTTPVLTNLSVTGSTACFGQAATVTVAGAESGVNYQAFSGTTPLGAPQSGSGNLNLSVNTSLLSTGPQLITIMATRPGCGAVPLSNQATVTVNALPSASVTPSGPITLCAGNTVSLSSSSSSGNLWNTNASTQNIVVSTTGNYSVTVTGANGCSATSNTVNVVVNPVPQPSISAGGPLSFCQGGSVVLTASGGSSYNWSNGGTGNAITATTGGNYTVSTTVNGCTGTSSPVTVNVLALPSTAISVSPSATVCAGTSVTLTGTGAQSYSWNNGVQNATPFVPPTSGTYTVTGTGSNGCSATATISLTVNSLPVVGISASPGASVCAGSPLTLSGTGAQTYSWTNGVQNGVAFTPSTGGSYQVTGTNTAGCSNTAQISITILPLPNVSFTANPGLLVCAGSSVTLSGNGASSYSWNGGISNGAAFTAQNSGSYTVTGTGSNGCTATATANLQVNPLPAVNAGSDVSVCDGNSVTLNASGATSYSWNNGVTNNTAFTPAQSGYYTVTGTDANNCSAKDSVLLTVWPLPVVNAGADLVYCPGKPLTLQASGGVSYVWNNGVTDNVPFIPTQSGNYVVTGTDGNNCTNSDTLVISFGSNPVFSLGADIVQVNPPATLDAGAGWTNISWSTGATSQTISVTSNGVYFCTVSNADGCSATDSIQVTFTTGIQHPDKSGSVYLYPNPASDFIHIRFEGKLQAIELYDMAGKRIYTASEKTEEMVTLDIRALSNGVYTLQIQTGAGTRSLRFVKTD
jgi:hypothetical protein